MLTCPHCKRAKLTVWQKLFIGPFSPATCPACFKKVGISKYWFIFVVAPVFMALFLRPILAQFETQNLVLYGSIGLSLFFLLISPLKKIDNDPLVS